MEDVVVPRAQIPTLMAMVHEKADELGVRILSFGHAGDGNVHITTLRDDMPAAEWEALVPQVSQSLYKMALALGGTITGEHGIGAIRRHFLPLALEEAQIEVMRRIRYAFDPNGILNPGKIFP